jgi:hypothetical protein
LNVYNEAGYSEGVKSFSIGQSERFSENSHQVMSVSNIFSSLSISNDMHTGNKKIAVDIGRIHDQIKTLCGELIDKPLAHLFADVLDDHTITAWVGVNDIVALSMMNFLNSCHISVPEAISIIGFDDSQEAFLHRITSYNFNIHALISAMLQYVFSPGAGVKASQELSSIEIDGFITIRESVKNLVNS